MHTQMASCVAEGLSEEDTAFFFVGEREIDRRRERKAERAH
jgi:hypothetical protein